MSIVKSVEPFVAGCCEASAEQAVGESTPGVGARLYAHQARHIDGRLEPVRLRAGVRDESSPERSKKTGMTFASRGVSLEPASSVPGRKGCKTSQPFVAQLPKLSLTGTIPPQDPAGRYTSPPKLAASNRPRKANHSSGSIWATINT